MTQQKKLIGQGASNGIAIGPVHLLRKSQAPMRITIKPGQVLQEIERFRSALKSARQQLESIKNRTLSQAGADYAAIFEAQILMLEDPELTAKTERTIKEELCNAEWALEMTGNEIASMLAALPDNYLSTRALDVRDVVRRLMAVLENRGENPLSELKEPAIVVSEELMPSDTAEIDRTQLLGFVMEHGSSMSHVAILARTMEIPAVVGVKDAMKVIKPEDTLIVDGDSGLVVINPAPADLQVWKGKSEIWDSRHERLQLLTSLPAITTDGHRIELGANIGSADDISAVLTYGAEAVGLFRTEFLFIGESFPSTEHDQFDVYRKVAEDMAGRPVIVRTLDVGGDKPVEWVNTPREANPFLGLRGIRLSFDWEEVFLVQLRALLRARLHGDIRVMFPMVSDLTELLHAKHIMDKAVAHLEARGQAYERAPVGIMIEVPSAAIMVDAFLEQVDFVSIGTNDLTQYTLAAERTNARVAALANSLHPAVLRLISHVAKEGHRWQKKVGICGDLAGNALASPLLLGLGVSELSMAPQLLPSVKEAIRSTSLVRAEEIAREALKCRTAKDVEELLGTNPN